MDNPIIHTITHMKLIFLNLMIMAGHKSNSKLIAVKERKKEKDRFHKFKLKALTLLLISTSSQHTVEILVNKVNLKQHLLLNKRVIKESMKNLILKL